MARHRLLERLIRRVTRSSTQRVDKGLKSRHPLGVQFDIPSDTNAIAPAVDRIIEGIRERCSVAGNCDDLAVALFEALANAVIHGNQQQAHKPVHISCEYEPNKHILITIRDEGAGFDPDAVPDPTSPENIAADHGRGILMMKTFMDEVRFEKGGTEVHLLKRCI